MAAAASQEPSPGAAQAPILRLQAIHKRFGDFVALESIDLDVMPREFFTILGPSGCGKSTLLRLIGGFEALTSGAIESEGVDLRDRPPERRPFNTVFQSYALFPHMSVADNVAYGLSVARVGKSEAQRRVGDALRLVDMEWAGERRPPTLSGGQRQRVALARALVNEPSILLLDEPLGALDLKLRHALQEELRAIQHRLGTTFIYVTHDQEEAMSLSDRICVMRHGAIAQLGTPRDLYLRPRSRYVADFIGNANLLECVVVAARPDAWEVQFPGDARAVMPCFADTRPRPGQRMTAVVRPEDVQVLPPTGEEAHAFSGTVTDVMFLGADIRYDVRLGSGVVLDARDRDSRAVVAPGDEVRVTIRPGTGALVPDDASADADAIDSLGVAVAHVNQAVRA